MKVALDRYKAKVVPADWVEPSNGPYYCIECHGEVIPKKGAKRDHHFAHKAESGDCGLYLPSRHTGESRRHQETKYALFLTLLKKNFKVWIEHTLDDARGDVVVEVEGEKINTEIQISPIRYFDIVARMEKYHDKDISVLWVFVNPPDLLVNFDVIDDAMIAKLGIGIRPEWQRYISAIQGNCMYFADIQQGADGDPEIKIMKFYTEEASDLPVGNIRFYCDIKKDSRTGFALSPYVDIENDLYCSNSVKISMSHPYGAWPTLPRRKVLVDTVTEYEVNGREWLRPLNPYEGDWADVMFETTGLARHNYYQEGMLDDN